MRKRVHGTACDDAIFLKAETAQVLHGCLEATFNNFQHALPPSMRRTLFPISAERQFCRRPAASLEFPVPDETAGSACGRSTASRQAFQLDRRLSVCRQCQRFVREYAALENHAAALRFSQTCR